MRVNLGWTPHTVLRLLLSSSLFCPTSNDPCLLYPPPRRHVRVWQRRLPMLKANSIAEAFILVEWRMRAVRAAAEAGWQEEPFNRCVFRVALSQPLSRAIDEGGSLWLRQGLKAPVREAWEPQQPPDAAAYQAGWQSRARCSPTVSKVERSFDRDATCRREEITRCSSGRNTSLHYIMPPDSEPLGLLQVCKTHTDTASVWANATSGSRSHNYRECIVLKKLERYLWMTFTERHLIRLWWITQNWRKMM